MNREGNFKHVYSLSILVAIKQTQTKLKSNIIMLLYIVIKIFNFNIYEIECRHLWIFSPALYL